MTLTPQQAKLFVDPSPVPHTVFVNDRVSFQTEDNQRVILVHGIVFSHYSLDDRSAEAYALVLLFESGYADQNDLAHCFGYSTRTLRRFQERLKSGGLSTLARLQGGRPSGSSAAPKSMAARDRSILRLKAKGMSNRWIGGRLGLDEKTIRKTLRRLGWKPAPQLTLPLLPKIDSHAQPVVVEDRSLNQFRNFRRSTLPT
jgi:DNA-binding CsgD family transcriptional regulator